MIHRDLIHDPHNEDQKAAPSVTEESQELIELDNLEDIEFLLDEIEDQIAPLAL